MTLATDIPGVCRDCGARNAPGVTRCWLCSAALHWPASSTDPLSGPDSPSKPNPQELHARSQAYYRVPALPNDEFVEVELVPERPHASRFSYSLTTIFAAMTIVAIAAGLFRDAPGLAMQVLLVGCPALLITVIRMGRLRAKGQEVTWTNRILTFILSSLAVAAVIALLAIAAILALFIYCLVVCGAAGKLF